MNALVNSLTVLGKPYTITRSKLGAITKVYTDQYVCDLPSIKELVHAIGEKISLVNATKNPEFSFLISFDDKTHHDGVLTDLQSINSVPIGKKTDRVVMRWSVEHLIDGQPNELSITVRISNPINPLVFLQAALSKSPSDIDNFEFEMGSTCVTVDGADQGYSDEIFLRVHNWIKARNKPHAFLKIHEFYLKKEWYVDQLNNSLLPLLVVSLASAYIHSRAPESFLPAIPPLIAAFFVLSTLGTRLNQKMATWARRAKHISLFQITNGDIDYLTKIDATSRNSVMKLTASGFVSILLNVIAAVFCYKVLGI